MTGGHGHVVPRADGARARCGGPRICTECQRELAGLTGAQASLTGTFRIPEKSLVQQMREASVCDFSKDFQTGLIEPLKRARELLCKGADEIENREHSFEIQWGATKRAIKRWQEAHPGNDYVWPDKADLLVWLMEQIDASGSGDGGGNSVIPSNGSTPAG